MGFIRSFDILKKEKLDEANAELFERLKADMYAGLVFSSVRKGEVHFYHAGGCLYKLRGTSFVRDKQYEKYNDGTEGIDVYEKAKKQNINRYSNSDGLAKERQLLDKLNKHTFDPNRKTKVVVLDIEVRLNGTIGGDKKCDMVLLNTEAKQIMFVEGKIFKDDRVNVAVGFTPEVIEQVSIYTAGIREQANTIVIQYKQHLRIINELFGTKYDLLNSLIPTAKLLVYETPKEPTANGLYSINTINNALGSENVMWITTGQEPTTNEIWEALCK